MRLFVSFAVIFFALFAAAPAAFAGAGPPTDSAAPERKYAISLTLGQSSLRGDAGQATVTVTVTLGTTFATDEVVTLEIGKAHDSARPGRHYTVGANRYTLIIPAGQTRGVLEIQINIIATGSQGPRRITVAAFGDRLLYTESHIVIEPIPPTPSQTPTPSLTPTHTPTPLPTPTVLPRPTPTLTLTPTPLPTPKPLPTHHPMPTAAPTARLNQPPPQSREVSPQGGQGDGGPPPPAAPAEPTRSESGGAPISTIGEPGITRSAPVASALHSRQGCTEEFRQSVAGVHSANPTGPYCILHFDRDAPCYIVAYWEAQADGEYVRSILYEGPREVDFLDFHPQCTRHRFP